MNFDALPGEEKWVFAPVAGPPVVGVRRSLAVNYSAQGLFRAGKALLCRTIVRSGEKCFEIIFTALGLFINQPHLPVDEGKESAGSCWRNSGARPLPHN
jgi:hypothetical protein